MQLNNVPSLGGLQKRRSWAKILLDPEYLHYRVLAEQQRKQKELLQKELQRKTEASDFSIDISLDFTQPKE